MATTYLGLATPTTGTEAGTWGDTVNNEISGYLDDYLAKPLALSLSSSNYTLTQAEARCQMIRMTGTLLANVTVTGASVLWNGYRCFQNLCTGSTSFNVTFTNSAGSVTIPRNRNGIVYMDPVNGPRIVSLVGSSTADPVPVGTKWAFYQSSAPSGYTQDSSLNDYAIRLVSSSGGGTGGSVDFSTVFSRVATDGYTLQIADIPPHTHPLPDTPGGSGLSGPSTGGGFSVYSFTGAGVSSSTGGGGSHAHGIDMRVKYANFIIASRS